MRARSKNSIVVFTNKKKKSQNKFIRRAQKARSVTKVFDYIKIELHRLLVLHHFAKTLGFGMAFKNFKNTLLV